MKNYNKILEAVNRGIQLALDDFDDEDQVQNIKSKQIQNRDYTKEYLDLMNDEVVDLDLPSGSLWCKYNLDVDPTKLSKAEDWYGDYYAWGELVPNKTNEDGKICFNWDNYKFYNKLTKQCNRPEQGLKNFTDKLFVLSLKDDAAYQNKKLYNFKFHIPTIEQFIELIKYTNNYWVRNYDPNKTIHNTKNDGGVQGLNGRIFEGKNGNKMFIPAAGSYDGSHIYGIGTYCYLWSSRLSLDFPNSAYHLNFDSDNINQYISNRYFGYNIRPVINL